MVRTFACAPCFRYAVFISGRKALREALISKSVDFADRLDLHSSLLVPARAKGKLLTSFVLSRVSERGKL